MRLLEELFYGELCPSDRILPGGDPQKEGLEAQFRATLSAEQLAQYDACQEAAGDVFEGEICEAFIRGFRMGMQFLLEGMKQE